MTAKVSLDAIRKRATKFAHLFSNTSGEKGNDQNFIREFCKVFGVNPLRLVQFQAPAKFKSGKTGWIDGLLPGKLLVEMKSSGKNLDEAYQQALQYLDGLVDDCLPSHILISDFQNLVLYDRVKGGKPIYVKLPDFPHNFEPFLFIADYEQQAVERQEKINRDAAERMGDLHDALKTVGCTGKELETYLVRLLFCFFADDTGLFHQKGVFLDYIVNETREDGDNLHDKLDSVFEVLDMHKDAPARKHLPESLRGFPHVNGSLFETKLQRYFLNENIRRIIIESSELDWTEISPAIFGAMFQAIIHHDDEAGKAKTKKRRELGAHYTSEENILKVIKPLFLDGLDDEFESVRRDDRKLEAFHQKLSKLTFLDPACGCGNFLVIAYRELRLLEMNVIEELHRKNQKKRGKGVGTLDIDIDTWLKCNVDQFYGIEIEGSAAQIATVAMWLTDHQMNMRVSKLGHYYKRLPLKKRAQIIHANALTTDWASVIPPERCSYVMGNPPFSGARVMSNQARTDLALVCGDVPNGGQLDLVCGWYIKASQLIQGSRIKVAFVSTNSITQGEQVGILWSYLLKQGCNIQFAHRTFRWSNDARGVAAVHCVIIGFGIENTALKTIYEYEDIASEAHAIRASNINPYLINAPNIILPRRSNSICDVPEICIGNKPIDGGHYLFTPEEKAAFLKLEPSAKKWFRAWIGADEFINRYERWCLWLGECSPTELRAMPEAMKRVEAVRSFRLGLAPNTRGKKTKKAPPESTQALAKKPTRFHVEFIPKSSYLVLPQTSSENRRYMPIGFLNADTFTSNSMRVLKNGTLFHFGVLQSVMHMAWMCCTTGRLESRYQYAAEVTYTNFPWPECAASKAMPHEINFRTSIEIAAQTVLDVRLQFPDSSLADLYDPLTMPPALLKAHQTLDRAVDAAYGKTKFASDAERVAFLFEKYQKLTSLLPSESAISKKRVIKKSVATSIL